MPAPVTLCPGARPAIETKLVIMLLLSVTSPKVVKDDMPLDPTKLNLSPTARSLADDVVIVTTLPERSKEDAENSFRPEACGRLGDTPVNVFPPNFTVRPEEV
jgi:hypothetical protein